MSNHEQDKHEDNKHLLFRTAGELYASPLLSVQEVMEARGVKPVPNSAPYFLGLTSLRGQIAGVIDLRIWLGLDCSKFSEQVWLVVKAADGIFAAAVDRVQCVVSIPEAEIEKHPAIRTRIPLPYLIGVARWETELVVIVDLVKVLSEEIIESSDA